jgi:hypothetical protein
MKIELEDEDVERIAKAVVAQMGDTFNVNGGDKTAATEGKGDKAAAKDKPKSAPKAAKVTKETRDALLDELRAYGAKHGKEQAKAIIATYAEAFGDVKDEDIPKLKADLDAKNAEAEDDTL